MAGYIKNREIDLSNLPTKKWGDKYIVDWMECKGEKAYFKYDYIEGDFTVTFSHYKKIPTGRVYYLKCTYKTNTVILQHLSIKYTQLENLILPYYYKYEVDTVINNIKIIKRLRIKGNYKGYLIKCLVSNNTYEVDETVLNDKYISKFTNWLYNEKDILIFLRNPEDARKFTVGSNNSIDCVCPTCKREKKVKIPNLYKSKSMACRWCSPTTSFPERVVIAYLEEIGVKYETQKRFNRLKTKRYDFYLEDFNTILEVHGKQHYEHVGGTFKNKLKEIQQNDLIKKNFCIKNNINYIEINAIKSDTEYILNSILKTEFFPNITNNQLLRIKKKVIQMNIINIEQIIIDFKSGKKIYQIAKKNGISDTKVSNILKINGITKEQIKKNQYNWKKEVV